jgi:phosphate/sulfate permease
MDAAILALFVIVIVALAFDYTNGFHDAANAIAVAVSTKALTPRAALASSTRPPGPGACRWCSPR